MSYIIYGPKVIFTYSLILSPLTNFDKSLCNDILVVWSLPFLSFILFRSIKSQVS
jgi:hypothetical protein